MKGIAIIVAAGKSERAGVDKVWTRLSGTPIVERAATPFFTARTVDEVVVAVRADRLKEAKALFAGREKPCSVVIGGDSRTESVRRALDLAQELAKGEDAVVAVHDGARPYVTRSLVEEAMTVAAEKGSAIPTLPCVDSLRILTAEGSRALPRGEVLRVQTPQCFRLSDLLRAYSSGEEATDDATLYERHIGAVTLIRGEEGNEKITYLSDINKIFASRVGVGYDVHPLAAGRPLVLGGVAIPHDKGLVGHSDADVLIHAIMDAILTAAGLPDIGHRFPPTDPQYEGANSMDLLADVVRAVREKGYALVNLSATIMAEKPKLAPHIPAMEVAVAKAVGCPAEAVTFAATTTEKLGIVGEEKGIAAQAVALLSTISD